MQKMKADDIALGTFKPGDLVRWIGAWQFPLVDAPPRDNTVLAITDDGMVWLEGRHGGERAQQWGCPPDQLVHREPTKSQGQPAQERQDGDELPECSACGETCHWNDEADQDDIDGVLCNPCAQRIASEFLAESEPDLKRLRAIVERDARKRHGDREGEPSWGVIADCVLAHVSQHRQAREILGVPEQVTLDQYVVDLSQHLRDFETGLVNAGKWDPYPELPLNLLAREIVAQAERWRIDAEHYRGEASNATAAMVEFLSAEVARLTGEVAATRSEAARQIGARDAELAALVTRAQRLAADLTSEANECTAHGLVSPATALRGAAAFLTSMGERVPRVFSAASSVEALHLRLEEADRHLAGLQEEAKRRDEALREETRKLIEYSNLVDQYKLGLAQVQGASAAAVSASLNPSPGATDLRHTLAAQLRVAAKTATAWEEAAIREWEPLAPSYHDGGGAVAPEIEGPYVEHRLVMAWRGQVQRMADNLSADAQSDAASSVQRLDYSKPPPGYSFPSLIGEEWYGAENFATTTLAIAAAWAHYKAHNDPPGMDVSDDGAPGMLWKWGLIATEFIAGAASQAAARTAAWAWYDRRHRLIERGLAHRGRGWMGMNPWPRCLTWSDPHVAAVERWLVDSTVEMPGVLRG